MSGRQPKMWADSIQNADKTTKMVKFWYQNKNEIYGVEPLISQQ